MAAGVEDGVELGRAAAKLLDGGRVLPQGLLVLEEGHGDGVFLGELDGALVERGGAALGGDDGELDVVLGEDVVGVGEFGLRVELRGSVMSFEIILISHYEEGGGGGDMSNVRGTSRFAC